MLTCTFVCGGASGSQDYNHYVNSAARGAFKTIVTEGNQHQFNPILGGHRDHYEHLLSYFLLDASSLWPQAKLVLGCKAREDHCGNFDREDSS